MSFRLSSSGGDALSFTRSGGRTPLRSLQNEILHPSTESSNVPPKPIVSSEPVKHAKVIVALDDALKNAPVNSTDGMTAQSSKEHFEHTSYSTEELDIEHTFNSSDVILKSYECDGGNVEISDELVEKSDDSIALPENGLSEYPQHGQTLDSSNIFDVTNDCNTEEEKTDHLYCKRETSMASVISTDEVLRYNPIDAVADITLKSLNCTGGEIEITDSIHLDDQTIPLPAGQSRGDAESYNERTHSNLFTEEVDHIEHPYCDTGAVDFHVLNEPSAHEVLNEKDQTEKDADYKDVSLINSKLDNESYNASIKAASFVSEGQSCQEQLDTNGILKQTDNHIEENDTLQVSLIKDEIVDASLPEDASPLLNTSQSENGQQPTQEKSHLDLSSIALSQPSSHDSHHKTISATSNAYLDNEAMNISKKLPEDASPLLNTSQSENGQEPTQEKSHLDLTSIALSQPSSLESHHETISATSSPNPEVEEMNSSKSESQVHSSVPPSQGCDTTDSALGLSANVPPVSTKQPQAETLPDVFKAISECTPLQLKFLTPIVRRASLACKQAQKELGIDQIVTDDCAPSQHKSVARPIDVDHADLWQEHLDSPMPRPLFNSTELVHRSQPCVAMEMNEDVSPAQPRVDKPVLDVPVIPEGPLQQQLRQMAEFLMLASGKMGPVHVPAPASPPPQAEHCDVCVGTSPMKMVTHSINTSGQFERKRSISVEDQGTLTDPLLWNVPMGSLEDVHRPELEQRLLSTMIIVEALVQQLAAARAHTLPPAGAAPSELRERAVQTEHTELSQTSMNRHLYLEALNRITELEMDASSLQNLIQYMQNVKTNMNVLTHDTEAALRQMKRIGDVVTEDHNSLVSNYAQMKSLVGKSRESQVRMIQKVKDALQDREDMRTKMEEAFSAKDTAYSVMGQLRKHCSTEISELEKCVGSQQELLSALRKAHPEQVSLNKAYSETLNSASVLLCKTTDEQSSLAKELFAVRGLLQKCTPMLQSLNKKADTALRERDEQIAERDQAVHDKQQTEEELNEALHNLQTAQQQISDLNLQVTILTSEMGVLRQKLSESDEERAQLDRKATELSATVSSTLASYTFLEQALVSETTKLQQSWTDIKQAKDRVQELESSLVQSEQCVNDLSAALAHSEDQVSQLCALSEAQAQQLQQLQEMCTQLRGVREENEFLQMENELSREQMAESERMLRENLQSLRERNIQCEDLNTELSQLQHANKNLQEELESVRTKLSTSHMEHKEQLEQIVTEIAILHHTVRSMTNELQASIKEEHSDEPSPHNISGSSVDSVMVAPTTEQEESPKLAASDSADVPFHLVFSESSAFTRITAFTPKRGRRSESDTEEQSSVSELLVGLDSTVTELRNTLVSEQQRKDALLKERQDAICRLQRELEAANSAHQTEVSELQFELNRLKARMEKANASLQQKAQGEKTVSKLVTEMSEIQEMHNKLKADNNELRKEVVELRHSLKQSKSETHFLRDELKKRDGWSAPDFMDEKIGLLKEINKLKMSLQAEEQARNKLLERAKRHQGIYLSNQQKSEKELQMLSKMINKVRETLLSLPASVTKCEQLQQLIEYVG
ncbi:sperm-associated antigen 5 isoform X2 [Periophthalmus magnuspinnatus]|uniref:sperm-associated antigen 5 isoform X2 n=1 Tax=Periophthalmus magnuspinnatus TaxID=409849 RepID=UPI0024366286|nr:sperm-associated antigen 5 isoform X2 [Periophthalmus magnuspinnatus]XP_055081478.1 sperm-associated antigen 5 isoform X2 [Periophthalmus magnuspinnatus]